MSASSSPVGSYGRVTASGAIRPGETGEVMIAIRGGVEAFLARDADGGSIEPYEEVAVVDYAPPREVLVTRLYGGPPAGADPLDALAEPADAPLADPSDALADAVDAPGETETRA